MPVDKFGRMSDTKTRDTGVSITYINNNYIRSDGGTPVSGSIDMRGNTLYNVPDPVNPQDVATKEYVERVRGGSPFLKENGNYKATHTINMAYNKLVNLHKPTEPYDAATKDYVDYVKSFLNESLITIDEGLNTIDEGLNTIDKRLNTIDERLNTIDKRLNAIDERLNTIDNPPFVMAHASYHGYLRKGEFQFTFGVSSGSGFLIPYSGRIRLIKVKILHDEDNKNIHSLYLSLWGNTRKTVRPDPIFTFTLNKENNNLNDLLGYNCFKYKGNLNPNSHYIRELDLISFLEKHGDKFTLLGEDIVCSYSSIPIEFFPMNNSFDLPVSEGDILNIRTEKENVVVWERDISFTYLITFLLELTF